MTEHHILITFIAAQVGKLNALMFAASKGHTAVVKALLAHPGIDVNLQDTSNCVSFTNCSFVWSHKLLLLLPFHDSMGRPR